jgi:beta-galactosidase
MSILLLSLLTLIASSIAHGTPETESQRTFQVDYKNNVFLKDGQPFRYISGEIHYFRASFIEYIFASPSKA